MIIYIHKIWKHVFSRRFGNFGTCLYRENHPASLPVNDHDLCERGGCLKCENNYFRDQDQIMYLFNVINILKTSSRVHNDLKNSWNLGLPRKPLELQWRSWKKLIFLKTPWNFIILHHFQAKSKCPKKSWKNPWIW